MYKLGTTLIFTELAEAAAAARLFGVYALQTQEGKGWSDKFSSVVEKGWETWQAERWRIVLDTEEKVQWFVPQVGDKVQYFDCPFGAGRITNIIGVEEDLFICKDDPSTDIDPEEFELGDCFITTIHYRNGKPFPQPQEVRHD